MPKTKRSGTEPYLSGAPNPLDATGHEPVLGGEHALRATQWHLLESLNKRTLTHLRRSAIGDWLATNGDPRSGVGLTADGLPDLAWCLVPGGDVQLRDSTDSLHIERFYISKYPVTWAQYRIFLEAEDGHVHPYWWDGLRHRAEYARHDTPVDNQPAQEVYWYDAIAYTRWLSSKMDYDVRLPNEWEWQQAATDGDPERLFPWGGDTGTMFANTKESNLRRATAVGMYPAGEAPCGALDMAGTVLEWCANEYANPERMELTGEARRVLRGGSWFLIYAYARNLFRTGNDPYLRFNSVGFRLVTNSLEPRPKPEPPPPMPEIIMPDASEDGEVDHNVTFPAPDGSILAADGTPAPEQRVKCILITGLSGTGKSTIIDTLASHGYWAVDADTDAYSEWADAALYADEGGSPVEADRDWVWREDRMRDLLASTHTELLFVSGTAANMGKFLSQFDIVILLTAPAEVMLERLAVRTNNRYGKDPEEAARAISLIESVEPLLRKIAGYEIDTRASIEDVVARIIEIAQG